MRAYRILPCCAALILICGALLGCSKGPSEAELKLAQVKEQFVTIQQLASTMAQTRTDQAAVAAEVAGIEATPEARRTDEQKARLGELTTRAAEITAKADATFEQLQGNLAEFLTTALNDFPDLPETGRALNLYADESIIVAADAVIKAGDYKKAGDQLQSVANLYDQANLPPYQPLTDKIAELDDWRFITQERFDTITNNMTGDEVKAAAGVPYYQNVKVDEKQGVETWLYRKRDGGASAVYFRIKTGKVYAKKWDAVKVQVVE